MSPAASPCQECQQAITPAFGRLYCSPRCRKRAWNLAHRVRRVQTSTIGVGQGCCHGCGRPFTASPRHPHTRYCNRRCRDRASAAVQAIGQRSTGRTVLGAQSADGRSRTVRCPGCAGELGHVVDGQAVILDGRSIFQLGAGQARLSTECSRCETLRTVITLAGRIAPSPIAALAG